MKKGKNVIQVLIILLILGILSGCSQQKKEVKDSDDWHDAQVMVHGIRLKDVGNMTVADLEKLGFEKRLYPSELDAGKQDYFSVVAKDGSDELYDFRVVNKTGQKASIDKCNIDSIYICIPDKKDEFTVATDISLINGVTAGMTSDEVKGVMGEPDEVKINDENQYVYKTWIYRTNLNEKGLQMVFEKDTDVMNTLIIRY